MKEYCRNKVTGNVYRKGFLSKISEEYEPVHVLPDWTPNTLENRPPVGETVMVLLNNCDHTNCRDFDSWTGEKWFVYSDYLITHWMPCPPLPDAPKADTPDEMPRCIDCGAEMENSEGVGHYLQCSVSCDHTMGLTRETLSDAIAAYRRLVEDRKIADRARAELEISGYSGYITRLLKRIIKGEK